MNSVAEVLSVVWGDSLSCLEDTSAKQNVADVSRRARKMAFFFMMVEVNPYERTSLIEGHLAVDDFDLKNHFADAALRCA